MKETISNSKSVFLFSTISWRVTLAIVLASLCVANLFSQTPSPTPQDKRGLGIENNPANTSQTDQSKSRETKPELVLQTGYNNFFGATRLIFSPDGRLLATATFRSSTIKLWETATGREFRSINLEHDPDNSLELCSTSDGRLLAAGIVEKRLKVWDLTAKQSERDLTPTTHDFSKVQFSPDGRFVALAEGYTVKAWEVATGRVLTPLNIPNIGVFAENGGVFLGFSNDGKRVATGGFGTQTLVWDTETGKQVQQMKGRSNPSYSVSFNADGTQLISGGRTRWDLRTGRGLRLTPAPSEKLFGMPSPDGRLVAMFAPNNNAIMILETTTGRALQTLTRTAPGIGVERVYFSPDGHLLVAVYMQDPASQSTGSMPATQSDVKIWDVNSGRELQTLT